MIYYKDSEGNSKEFKNRGEMEEYLTNQNIVTNDKTIIEEECAIVISNNKIKFSLHVTPNKNRKNGLKDGAYFKWVNDTSFTKATEIARIRFDSPFYEIHGNSDGKRNIELNSSQKKEMINLLSSNIKGNCYKIPRIESDYLLSQIITGWKLLIYYHNKVCLISEQKMIDYTLGKIALPLNMIPFDTPMPDYTKLSKKVNL